MGPTLDEIQEAAERLQGVTIETPVPVLSQAKWADRLPDADIAVKLELFQQTGSFKARGTYLGLLGLDDGDRAAGVVAASGGNHALAVAWAAQTAGVHALIAMPNATDPIRINGCRDMGAEVVLCDDMQAAFSFMEQEAAQGRFLMHPFEASHMVLGGAVLAAEYLRQAPDLDTFVIPIGGGGLISGMSAAIKMLKPSATVIGVEPIGADSMSRSFASGAPVRLDRITTIADSLGSPLAMPYTFSLAQKCVDEIVHVTDAQMVQAMQDYHRVLNVTAEPACAASLAAICGPLRDQVIGRAVGIIACGSNIGPERYRELTT